MRREYIKYPLDIPVNIFFTTVKEYPIHWHNCLEIIWVLEGSIKIRIESNIYEIEKDEIEIINANESHSIHSKDKNNKVVVFQFDLSFFEKYYSDINNMVFYANTIDKRVQHTQEYTDLKTYLSIILCEAIEKKQDYDEEIKSTLVDMLFHLINNFHYLIYEQEELKDNEEQLERYHRIGKYIFNNYNNKISLQEIAKEEYLSAYYLSHEIKNAMGYSFTDLLNLTRVQESVKLLLDTDKNISEISEEVGFSHTRYYNKHFKVYFKCTPIQFRKKYKFDEETYEKQKEIINYKLKDSIIYVTGYLENYDRFNYENKIIKINIDMNKEMGELNDDFIKVVNLGDAFNLLIEDNRDILEEIQEEIPFKFGRISNIFSADMGIFPCNDFYNWNRTKTVLQYMEDIDLKPLILLNNNDFEEVEFINILNNFIEYFEELETININNFEFQIESTASDSLKKNIKQVLTQKHNLKLQDELYTATKHSIDSIYDTLYMLPFIIHNVINENKNLQFLKAFDVLDKQTILTNEVFFGYPGLVNNMGIKKPAYYAYYLLNKLGNKLVDKGDGYIVTKKEDEFQILLYSYYDNLDNLVNSKENKLKNNIKKEVSLNIVNVCDNVRMTIYNINEKMGSSYNYWLGMGRPIRLNKEEKQILYKASFPKIHFKYSKKSIVLNTITSLKGYGAVLILIKKLSKHQK